MKYTVNEVKLDLASYRHYVRGTPKIGKTKLYRDLILENYGDPKYGILLSMGDEVGYNAMSKIIAHSCPTWGEFTDTVDDLVDNKNDNEFKVVAIDTVDELVKIAERKVMDIHRAQKGESASSINSALGGFGAGKKKARSLIEDQIGKLERAGYGMFYIGHTKLKDVTEVATDVKYEQVTGSLEFAYDAIFSDRADIMPMIVMESKTKEDRLVDSKRVIYFRSNNFIDAGSRVENLPEKIELSARGYIDAINSALEKTAGVTGKDAEKVRKNEEVVREEKAEKFIEQSKADAFGDVEVSIEEYREKIKKLSANLSIEEKGEKKAELTRLGLPMPNTFSSIEDMEILKKIHKVLSGQ